MRWIANKKNPPRYVWKGDEWLNESDKKTYIPNFEIQKWESGDESIPFSKNTKIFSLND